MIKRRRLATDQREEENGLKQEQANEEDDWEREQANEEDDWEQEGLEYLDDDTITNTSIVNMIPAGAGIQQTTPFTRPLHPEEVKSLISEFSGESVAGPWLRKLEHYQKLYGWTETATLLHASMRLAGPAKLWYQSIEEMVFSFQGFKYMLLTNFPSHHDEADIHRELMAVIKSPLESYDIFVFKVQNIASKGQVPESSVIKYIISGLSRDKLYDYIASAEYSSVFNLLKRLKWCESNYRMKKPSTGGQKQRSVITKTVAQAGGGTGQVAGLSEFICFNCREPGHKSISCPKPQRRPRCNLCSKVGHNDSQCFGANAGAKQSGDVKAAVSKGTVALISTNEAPTTSQQMYQEDINTDDEGMATGDVIIGRRLKQMNLMVDSGSAVSLIKRSELCNLVRVDSDIDRLRKSIDISGINQSKVNIVGYLVTKLILQRFKVFDVCFWVVADDTMEVSAILGRDFLKSNNIAAIRLDKNDQSQNCDHFKRSLMNVAYGDCFNLSAQDEESFLIVGDDTVTFMYRDQVNADFENFYRGKTPDLEKTVKYVAAIRLKENKYFNVSPQRFSRFEREAVDAIVSEWLDKGIIRESDSPYSSRVVLVKKKKMDDTACA